MDIDGIVDYIRERQNEDGGYSFCRGAESNAEDTYYAIEILRMLEVKPRNMDKTVAFLQGLQYQDGRFDSVKVAYYVTTTLTCLGSKPLKPISKVVRFSEGMIEKWESADVYIEAVSEIENLYLAVEILKTFNSLKNSEDVQKHVLRLQNNDGSFGSERFSRIASTFYALKTLILLGYNVKTLCDVLRWIRRCEVPSGGFVSSPEESSTHMEDTYFGVKALKVLNEIPRYPQKTLKFVAWFQNPNGGFRRSIFLGISDFESTYQAVSVLKTLLTLF